MARPALRPSIGWLGGLLALYLLVPIVAFIVRLAGSSDAGFGAPGLLGALYVSVATASISLVIMVVAGLPLAYALTRSRSRIAALIGVVVQLPLAIPPLVSGILLVYLVGPYTSLGRLFGGHLTETMVGIVLAQVFVAAPFLIVAARSAFAAVDSALLDAAATLGHRETARFFKVALPVAWPGVRAGMLLAWLRAFGEFGATVVLAYHPYSLPVFSYLQFGGSGLASTEAPTAIALGTAVVVGGLFRLPAPRRRHRVLAPPRPVVPAPSARLPVRFALDYRLGEFHLSLAHAASAPNLAILGPSGSGKSVTLRCLAGLLGGAPGAVYYGDRLVSPIPVEARHVGYLPQRLAFLPHLDVWRQLLLGTGVDERLAAYWLERLGLVSLAGRRPGELSGGERQRVALAQALARAPELVFLDEPFSALDAPVRTEIGRLLRSVQRSTGMSSVVVTHDPREAALLADEVIVIEAGTLLQAGALGEVFGHPASPAVARLVGIENFGAARICGPGLLAIGGNEFAADTKGLATGAVVTFGVRTEHLHLVETGGHLVQVIDVVDLGSIFELAVALGSGELRVRTDRPPPIGGTGRIELPAERVMIWPDPEG